ncbi:hypothetical protein A2U01_0022793, partial [Trifolium medium]|nr:hypothetical protein [Trifolium medium]
MDSPSSPPQRQISVTTGTQDVPAMTTRFIRIIR